MPRTTAHTETAVDPIQARAEFFLELEVLELTRVIPQASPSQGAVRY